MRAFPRNFPVVPAAAKRSAGTQGERRGGRPWVPDRLYDPSGMKTLDERWMG